MSLEPSKEDLNQSIDDLRKYRDRLQKELISIGQKLRMPKKNIELTLQEHPELKKAESALSQLIEQKAKEQLRSDN